MLLKYTAETAAVALFVPSFLISIGPSDWTHWLEVFINMSTLCVIYVAYIDEPYAVNR